ncbi:MAG: DNA replication/repair protein RecF [Granulosicoccus sp.]
MILTQFDVIGIRNLDTSTLLPHTSLNLVTGANGAGKSSVLEAIHCLSVGHSFRTRKARELISRNRDHYSLTARFNDPATHQEHRCGMKRSRDGSIEIRLNYEPVKSLAEITRILPVKALSPDSHQLIQEGPEHRRQFIDWGLFHVEPTFFDTWRQYRRCLSQRNQALRDSATDSEVCSWNELLSETGTNLNAMRSAFVGKLLDAVQQRLTTLEAVFSVDLRYRSGWVNDETLFNTLEKNLENHRRFRTTTDGPHRAEMVVIADEVPARQILSRGQQKVFVYLLHLAQLDLLAASGTRQAIVVCDDLISELDEKNAFRLVQQLVALTGQTFVSGVNLDVFRSVPHKVFHVEHGQINKTEPINQNTK